MSVKVSCACFALLTDRRCGSTTTKYLPEIEFVCLFSLLPATSVSRVAARARIVSQARAVASCSSVRGSSIFVAVSTSHQEKVRKPCDNEKRDVHA